MMSDVLSTNLMLTGLLFLFSTFPLVLGRKQVRFMIYPAQVTRVGPTRTLFFVDFICLDKR